MARVAGVDVAAELKSGFMGRHRKDLQRALDAWDALVRVGARLAEDPFHGTQIPKERFPRQFRDYPNLWNLNLPHAFRAVSTVISRPDASVRVAIDWIGDHEEYDRLFGYS